MLLLAYFPLALGIEGFSLFMVFIASINLSSQIIVLGLPIILMRENIEIGCGVSLPSFRQSFTLIALYFGVTIVVHFLTDRDWLLAYFIATAGLTITKINTGILRGLGYIFLPQLFDGTTRNIILAFCLFLGSYTVTYLLCLLRLSVL